jgi:hypothetical protein
MVVILRGLSPSFDVRDLDVDSVHFGKPGYGHKLEVKGIVEKAADDLNGDGVFDVIFIPVHSVTLGYRDDDMSGVDSVPLQLTATLKNGAESIAAETTFFFRYDMLDTDHSNGVLPEDLPDWCLDENSNPRGGVPIASPVSAPVEAPTSYHDSASSPVASPTCDASGYEISFLYNALAAPSSCPAGDAVETVEECKVAGLSVGGNLYNGEVYVGTWPYVR